MDFSQVLRKSESVDPADFLALIDKTIKLLKEETAQTGKLIHLKPAGEAIVIGDLHGDLTSFSKIIDESAFIKKIGANTPATLVFLGDYGDRGPKSPELYYAVLRLKLAFPEHIVLLRGNHEGPSDLTPYPHDLPVFLQRKFKENWTTIYQHLRKLFNSLCNAVYVEERYLMVHGGLPQKIHNLQDIAQADQLHPQKPFLEELLWSDPDEQVHGVVSSPRGAGHLFGKAITLEVLQKLGVQILIRGHESAPEGFKINHDGKVLTLFSCKEPPYFNSAGAFLEVPLSESFENASQLLPYIHKF